MYETELKNFSIAKIADSGQCFRILPEGTGYVVIAFGKVLRVTSAGSSYRFSCDEQEFKNIWFKYFDLDCDYEKYKDVILPHDDFLKEAIHFGDGIRILKQDPWESLISFIISQRKSVKAIRTSISRLSHLYGKNIDGTHFSFPGHEILAKADEAGLRSCGLGYRLPYVLDAARSVDIGYIDLKNLGKLETSDLLKKLMELNGVGIKVASCVALFAFHRLEVLPIDIWMKRIIETRYGGHFPREYLPFAGVLQQYMYYYARLKNLSWQAFDYQN